MNIGESINNQLEYQLWKQIRVQLDIFVWDKIFYSQWQQIKNETLVQVVDQTGI